MNGDGRDDLLVSAHRSDAGGGPNAGAVYVVYGDEGIPATIDLGTLDGTNGVTVLGIDAEDEAGSALAHARDVNGDGFDDIVIGARRADPGGRAKAGEVYVVYGGDNLPATLPLASLDGENGFVVRGVDEDDEAGFAVAGIGDFNGDGFDDIAATAPVALPDFVLFGGETYVVYGGDRLPAVVELASLDGTNGTRFDGIDFGDTSGECVAGVGDVDQDGFADFVIGATLGDPGGVVDAGEAYVVLGAADYGASFDLEDLDGTNGSVLEGVAPNDATGGGCGGGVDLDGDGVEEVVVGAQGADPNGSASGRAYVVYGRAEVELIAAGVCPGDVTLRASGLTPGGLASVVAGSTRGETEIPAGECAGRAVDIADASLVAMLAADGAGELEIVRAVTESFCGGLLQWVDMESCRMSPVVALP